MASLLQLTQRTIFIAKVLQAGRWEPLYLASTSLNGNPRPKRVHSQKVVGMPDRE